MLFVLGLLLTFYGRKLIDKLLFLLGLGLGFIGAYFGLQVTAAPFAWIVLRSLPKR